MRAIVRVMLAVSLLFATMYPGLTVAKERITIGSGSPGAIYYLFGAAVANLINQKAPNYVANSVAVGGSAENAMLLQKRQQEFGLMSNDTAYHAYYGIEEFKGKACPNIRAVTSGYAYAMNLIVPDNSPIKSYKDLVGKKVATGPAGGSYHIHVGRIMSAGYNIDINKTFKQFHGSYNVQPDFLADGVVDAIWNPSGVIPETRGGGTYNLACLKKVRFISIDEEAAKKILTKYPYFVKVVLPPGFFPNQNAPYTCLAVPSLVGTHDKVSNEMVYTFVKTIYEYKDELLQAFPGGKDYVDPTLIKSLPIPLHPGALKYYKEKRIETPKF